MFKKEKKWYIKKVLLKGQNYYHSKLIIKIIEIEHNSSFHFHFHFFFNFIY